MFISNIVIASVMLNSECNGFKTCGYKEVISFHEPFDKLNFDVWNHEISMSGGGNWEFQIYENDRETSYINNGTLVIEPRLSEEKYGKKMILGQHSDWQLNRLSLHGRCTNSRDWGCERIAKGGDSILPPIRSAKLSTKDNFWFQYGRVEFVARMPKGDWMWPALWLLPKYETYGEWPRSGEIDVLESKGNDPSSISSALHWGEDLQTNAYKLAHNYVKQSPDEFHTYGLYWDKNGIYTYIDSDDNKIIELSCTPSPLEQGKLDVNKWKVNATNCAPFDHPMYLIVNLAVGGTMGYFKDSPNKPWNDGDGSMGQFYRNKDKWFPTWKRGLEIKDIKVWRFDNKEYENY